MDSVKWKKLAYIYLIIVDYYSRFIKIHVAKLNRATTDAVIQYCKNIFSRQSIPEKVATSNGSQFDSYAFCRFSKEYQFHHLTSSLYYPRNNGEAERGGLLKKVMSRIRCF